MSKILQKIKVVWQKAWKWLVFACGVVVAVLLYVRYMRNASALEALKNEMAASRAAYQKEREAITESYENQRIQEEHLQQQYQATLSAIEEKYAVAHEEVTAKEHEAARTIVREAGGSDEEISRRLANQFGINFRARNLQ